MNTSLQLQPSALKILPLGEVKPAGWLLRQLEIQAQGLTGHLDEFWPSVAQSRWIGGEAEGWERGPYWLDGLIPLAFLLNDEKLIAKARHWIDYILQNQHGDGWFGAKDDEHLGEGLSTLDPWPQFVLFKALTQWQSATDDARIVPAMERSMARIFNLLKSQPLESWAKMRWPELWLGIIWLYEKTGADWLMEMADLSLAQGYDWRHHFTDFRFKEKTPHGTAGLPVHGVNTAMAIKTAAVLWRQSGKKEDLQLGDLFIDTMDEFHGQVTGMFSGDEHYAGKDPSQGTELCSVVEYMYSLEELVEAFGSPHHVDRLERIAYNALPATCTPNMWAHQYDQQPNQVLVNLALRDWTSNGVEANLYGLEPNFGCCTANLHQGWPKLTARMWMRAQDGGLVATILGPSHLDTIVAGQKIRIETTTNYPFGETLAFKLTLQEPAAFPLSLRIPGWAIGATVQIGQAEKVQAAAGTFHRIDRTWQPDDIVTLHLPMPMRTERRYHKSVSFVRGPIVLALKIDEVFRHLRGEAPHDDFEVYPASPWNYGVRLDLSHETELREQPVGKVPFEQASAPVTVSLPAQRLIFWRFHHDSAGPLPESPTTSGEPLEKIELVPYGSTNLRIAEFPEIKPNPAP